MATRLYVHSHPGSRPRNGVNEHPSELAERLRTAFEDCLEMDGPLAERLSAYAAASRAIFPAYGLAVDKLVERVEENGGGRSAPAPGQSMPPFMLPDETGRFVELEALLSDAVTRVRAERKAVHIFDPAAGCGRYVIDAVRRLTGGPVTVTLRDWNPANAQAAAHYARQAGLGSVSAGPGDAFDRRSLAGIAPRPDIAVVSGLYELFPDNAPVADSLAGLAEALAGGGYLIYTNQPWHPQLEMIARVLDNREGKPWVMRCRTQAEMDALVRAAGFEKLEMLTDPDGIFTVSLARRSAPAGMRTLQEVPAYGAKQC